MMQETRHQYKDSDPATALSPGGSQRGTAIHLGLSHLIAGAVALGFSAWLTYLHIPPFSALLVALAAAAICGSLCTLNLQYSLYLLELTLSRLAHEQFSFTQEENNNTPSFTRRWPLDSLFLQAQEVEQRLRRFRAQAQLATDVRAQALQQAREAAALAERNRIARELHDSIKQHIFGINASAAAARAYWQRENLEGARAAIEDIEHSTQGAQVEMQALLQQLRPAPLENMGLLDALRTQAQALGFRTGARIDLDLATLPDQDRLLPGTQETIFRLIQEAFANIARHARAQMIWLAVHTVGQKLHITVRDDGQGFDPRHVRSGMGLSNLRERTHALQGSVEVSSQPGQGTTVLITIPLMEALPSPADEVRQRYELARAEELARREYRRCVNACFMSVALGLIGIINIWDTFFSVNVLAALLIAVYGYASGIYYHTRVASSAGRESRPALELAQEHYRAGLCLLLPTNLGIWYFLKLVAPLGATPAPWLTISLALCLVGLIQWTLQRDAKMLERAFSRFSFQEMGNELEKHQQTLSRAFIIWAVAGTTGLIVNRSLLTFPPATPAQQDAYGLAIILLLIGLIHLLNRQHIQRWKQRLRADTTDQYTQSKEE